MEKVIIGVIDPNNPTGKVNLSADYVEHMAIQGFSPTEKNFYTGSDLSDDPYGPVSFVGPCAMFSEGAQEMMQMYGWTHVKFKDFYQVLAVWLYQDGGDVPKQKTLSWYSS